MIFLTGKVVIDDGSVLTESVSIQTICKGPKAHRNAYRFPWRVQLSVWRYFGISSESGFDADMPSRSAVAGRPERRDLRDCDLQARSPDSTSDSIPLVADSLVTKCGRRTHTLHRLAKVEGFTISGDQRPAPGAARRLSRKARNTKKASGRRQSRSRKRSPFTRIRGCLV